MHCELKSENAGLLLILHSWNLINYQMKLDDCQPFNIFPTLGCLIAQNHHTQISLKCTYCSCWRCFKNQQKLVSSFFNLFIFNWRIIALQYCVVFCQTSVWISHRYNTSLPSWNSHPLPSRPTPLSCYRALVWVPWVM